jgi:hypothetical protein
MGLNFLFPKLGPTGIPIGVTFTITNVIILVGLWRGLARTDFPARTRVAVWLAIAVPFTLWTALIWGLALQDTFRAGSDIPRLPFAIFTPVLVGLVLLTRSRHVTSLLDATPASRLIGLQVYRVLGGIFLVNWAAGDIPGAFALPAGIGDIAVGLLALPAALRVSSGTPGGRKVGIWWNLLGLADFAVAIAMGMLSSPGRFQAVALAHPNIELSTFPIVMIPAFAVPNSILLHALSLWQLKRMGNTATDARAPGKAGPAARLITGVAPVR